MLSESDSLNKWVLALKSPFNPKAQGVRIPDPYAYPTSTFHTEGTFTISTDTTGMASVLVIPHPFLSLINMNTGSTITTSMLRYNLSNSCYSAVPRAVLSDKLANFRLVAVGLELRNLLNQTVCTGRVICAKVPCLNDIPGPDVLNNTPCDNFRLSNLVIGIDTVTSASGLPSSIITLPGSLECTMQNIITNKVTMSCMPITPEAYNFHVCRPLNAITNFNDYIDG